MSKSSLVLLALAVPLLAGATVPDRAESFRPLLTSAVQRHHGDGGPVALHAALIHQESTWRPEAVSRTGAQGLAQIMPGTAEHVAELLGRRTLDPTDPEQAIRGLAAYTAWLREHIRPRTGEHVATWAFVLAAYHGGLRTLEEDRDRAAERGLDPDRWWGHVERVRTHEQETRAYVRRILLELRDPYLEAGWPGALTKEVER